jgi:acyl-CoA thioesterase FadM
VRCSGTLAVTANLNINFRKFIRLQQVKKIEAKVDRVEGNEMLLKYIISNLMKNQYLLECVAKEGKFI